MGEQVGAGFIKNILLCECGGVAQLGEHLPCKQGVKSSNLSISTGGFYKPPHTYLENRILKTISVKKRFLPGGREPEGEGAE